MQETIKVYSFHTFVASDWTYLLCETGVIFEKVLYLVVSTELKNISQNGNLPQVGVNIENI